MNPDDVCYVYFQDPADDTWHQLVWEHAPGLGTPFSAEAARYARRLAARLGRDRWPDPARALAELLGRWNAGMVTDRRERRMAVRLAAERAALPIDTEPEPAGQVVALPTLAAMVAENPPAARRPAPSDADADIGGDDDDPDELFDDPNLDLDGGDFYADAFEVIE